MRVLVAILSISVFLVLARNTAADEKAGGLVPGELVPGELLVKFKSGFGSKADEIIAEMGARLLEKLGEIDVSRLEIPKGLSIEKAMQRLSDLPFVEYAEPNYIRKLLWAPSDPKYRVQWGLQKIRAASGWGIQTGGAGVKIAIVDTGVDLDHPDLKKKIVAGYDFVDNDDEPDDVGGHGTHCAGIAAAAANNGIGVAGVCPNCSLMPIRVLAPWGGSTSTVAKGIIWAADHGAQVISLSLGSQNRSTTELDAINYAVEKGALIIAAAGNEHSSAPHYPAYHDVSLAVGASLEDDKQASFSNYGSWVDVAAPGNMIISTVPDDDYSYKSGTSMSAPYVSGLAGLLFSCQGATASSVRRAIESGSRPVGEWVQKGRIDVRASLEQIGCRGKVSGGAKSGGGEQGTSGGGEQSPSGPVKEIFSPSGYALNSGKTLSSPSNSLVKSDDRRLVLESKGVGLKRVLDFYVTASLRSGVAIGSLEVKIEASSQHPGEASLYGFNWGANKWDWLGKVKLSSSDAVASYMVKNHEAYVSPKGEVRVKLYREEKRWTKFGMSTDWVSFVTVRQTAESGAGSKSLGERVKEKWKKWTR